MLSRQSGNRLEGSNPSPSATEREVRSFVWAALVCFGVGCLAAFGWGREWNAYINLMLTLGDCVLWFTFAKLIEARRG